MSTFRTKLVIKQWKTPNLHQAMKQMQDQQIHNIPIHTYQNKTICNRCGMIWDGPMSYCCPEGSMCGVPKHQNQIFIPTVWRTQ